MIVTEEKEYNARFDFLCERKLKAADPALHERFRSSVFSMDRLLANYKNIFPFFTNHTFEHSEQVINYCNVIAGDEIIGKLNSDELYILLMGAALHDVGMGISESDFRDLCGNVPSLVAFIKEHPNELLGEYTRLFHQELSAEFIRKYSRLFDIPTEAHIHCIAQIARGHRKCDLLDLMQFPTDFLIPNGNKVNLAYLSSLVKFADELDVASDRNLLFNYNDVNQAWSEKQTMCYKCHGAIKRLGVREDSLVLYYETDDEDVEKEILETKEKVERTFAEYQAVTKQRTNYINRIRAVEFENLINKN